VLIVVVVDLVVTPAACVLTAAVKKRAVAMIKRATTGMTKRMIRLYMMVFLPI
jgi:hypothetical protein